MNTMKKMSLLTWKWGICVITSLNFVILCKFILSMFTNFQKVENNSRYRHYFQAALIFLLKTYIVTEKTIHRKFEGYMIEYHRVPLSTVGYWIVPYYYID